MSMTITPESIFGRMIHILRRWRGAPPQDLTRITTSSDPRPQIHGTSLYRPIHPLPQPLALPEIATRHRLVIVLTLPIRVQMWPSRLHLRLALPGLRPPLSTLGAAIQFLLKSVC